MLLSKKLTRVSGSKVPESLGVSCKRRTSRTLFSHWACVSLGKAVPAASSPVAPQTDRPQRGSAAEPGSSTALPMSPSQAQMMNRQQRTQERFGIN